MSNEFYEVKKEENQNSEDIQSGDDTELLKEAEQRDREKIAKLLESSIERDATKTEKGKLDKSLDHKREDTRSNLANWLIWLLVGTYGVTFVCSLCVMFIPVNENNLEERDKRYTYTKDIFALLITTQTGLVGSVIGFYFGSNQNRDSSN